MSTHEDKVDEREARISALIYAAVGPGGNALLDSALREEAEIVHHEVMEEMVANGEQIDAYASNCGDPVNQQWADLSPMVQVEMIEAARGFNLALVGVKILMSEKQWGIIGHLVSMIIAQHPDTENP